MDLTSENEEVFVDSLSECSVSSDFSDDSDDSDIISYQKHSGLPLQYSDSEDDGTVTCDNSWSTTDKPITLEPFEGNSGIKVMPKSQECVADVIELFIGEDLLEYMVSQSNIYHSQIEKRLKISSKTRKWTNITVPEMKKFLGLIIIMGQVRKERLKDYWSTDPFIETPIFSKVMSRDRFMQIWQSWHFSNNDDIIRNSSRLVKIQPIMDYFKKKFNEVYIPCQQLSLDECIIK